MPIQSLRGCCIGCMMLHSVQLRIYAAAPAAVRVCQDLESARHRDLHMKRQGSSPVGQCGLLMTLCRSQELSNFAMPCSEGRSSSPWL